MVKNSLPSGFEILEPFVSNWALGTTAARTAKRHSSTMEEIQEFYDTVMHKAEMALSYLSNVPYNQEMSDEDRDLTNILLSLSEVTTAVEWYKQPAVQDGYDYRAIQIQAELP